MKKTRCNLETKLNKLPHKLTSCDEDYFLTIDRVVGVDIKDSNHKEFFWEIIYRNPVSENEIFYVAHNSLQAAVDNALHELKYLNYI